MWRLRIYNTCMWRLSIHNTHICTSIARMHAQHMHAELSHNIYAHTRVQDDRNRSHTKHKTNKVTDTARPRVLDEEKS